MLQIILINKEYDMKIIKSKINRLCCIGISFMLIFGLTTNYSFAQCDFAPGDNALFDNAGYNATNTNQVCYLVDADGNVVATDPSGACDFPGVAYGAYSVYALNDCTEDMTTDIIGTPPTTLAEIMTAAGNDDVDMAGPADFTVCPPSSLTGCEGDDIIVSSMPDYNSGADNSMMYVMVCDGEVMATSMAAPTATMTIPDDGNPATQPASCEVHAVNYCSPDGDATAAAITVGATWSGVDPTGDSNFDMAMVPLSLNCVLLSTKMTNFDVRCDKNDTKVSWTTASEENVFSFVIERSITGQGDWIQVGQIQARGTNGTATDYHFTDKRALGGAYYRLQVVEFNGESTYSDLRQVECLENGIYDIFPNPTSGKVTVTYEAIDENPITFTVVDVLGRTLMENNVTPNIVGINTHEIDFKALAAGMYFIVLNINNNDRRIVEKVIKRSN